MAHSHSQRQVEVEAFSELTRGTDILVYPCLYGWPGGYGRITTEMCRGLANNYWFQGADGIYTFNWNAHYVQRPEEQTHAAFAHQLELLREIDDPERMRGNDKTFAAVAAASRHGPTRTTRCMCPGVSIRLICTSFHTNASVVTRTDIPRRLSTSSPSDRLVPLSTFPTERQGAT